MTKYFLMCSSQPTPQGNWKLAFLLLIATMIFLLKSEPHSFLKTCLLCSALNVAPSIPSQTPPHRKVTGERNKTGGIQHLRATFLKIEHVTSSSTAQKEFFAERYRVQP